MNDLFYIEYEPKRMLVDSMDMPKDVELAHRRLCDFIWAMDRCPQDEVETLMGITRVASSDWIRVRGGLETKGWHLNEGFFEHDGALRTLQAAKDKYAARCDRTKAARLARNSPCDNDCNKGCNSKPDGVVTDGVTRVQSESESESESEVPVVQVQGKDICREVIAYLNRMASRSYRDTDTNLKLVGCRLKEPGVTVVGIKAMIDRMVAKWGRDPKMSEYLRPETLFGKTKFGGYYDNRSLPITGAGRPNPADKF